MSVSLRKDDVPVREITLVHLMDEEEAIALYGVKPIPPISQSTVSPGKDDDRKQDAEPLKAVTNDDAVCAEAIDRMHRAMDCPESGKDRPAKIDKKKKDSHVGHYYGGLGHSHSHISALFLAVFFMIIGSIGVDGICGWAGNIASAILNEPVNVTISDSFVSAFNMLFYVLGAIFGAIGVAGTAMSMLRRL